MGFNFKCLKTLKMYIALKKEKKSVVKTAEAYCVAEGLNIELVYSLPEDLLTTISKRSEALPSLYFVSIEMLQSRLENGCFLIKKNNEVYGHIFAHKHLVNEHAVYELSLIHI